jgi:hypothetical protein
MGSPAAADTPHNASSVRAVLLSEESAEHPFLRNDLHYGDNDPAFAGGAGRSSGAPRVYELKGPRRGPRIRKLLHHGVTHMQYALFIYEDESLYGPGKSGPALRELVAQHMAFNRELGATRIGGAGLAATASATTVRTTDGKKTVHDGAFAETKEQLGGFYLIEAPDLDTAISIAKQVPVLQNGAIEIRPLLGAG